MLKKVGSTMSLLEARGCLELRVLGCWRRELRWQSLTSSFWLHVRLLNLRDDSELNWSSDGEDGMMMILTLLLSI